MNMCRFLCLKSYFKGPKVWRQFLILLFIAGCTNVSSFSEHNLKGFAGAPDVTTQTVGQNVLLAGGNAADHEYDEHDSNHEKPEAWANPSMQGK